MRETEEIPVLRAKKIYRGKKVIQLKVWCEYCNKYHFHGTEEGHRIAHCWKEDSPFNKTGYILKRSGEE